MGEIRDIINTLVDVKTELTDVGIYSTKRSISASAMEGTANFPCLVEDTMSLDEVQLITRGLEKNFASFLLTVLSMEPFLEVTKGKTPSASEYLKQFHQNTRVKDSVKGLHMSIPEFLSESCNILDFKEYSVMEEEAIRTAFMIYEGVSNSVVQNKNIQFNYVLEDIVSRNILNNIPVMEKSHGKNKKPIVIDFKPDIYNHVDVDSSKLRIHQNVRDRGNQWKILSDNDCKKANDLVPTMLHIRVYPIDKYTRKELSPIDFMVGVKATIHPIPLDEIARIVVSGMRNENVIFNFLRWTTGEIKFFRDFLFAVDTQKMDAKDSGNNVTGWRPALKRRKMLSDSKFRITKNSILPNATLIVTQAGISHIKDTYGYDLNQSNIKQQIMKVYFLLGFVTVDTVTQRVGFRFDGIEDEDVRTYASLQRESNNNDDKAFKNMMRMLGRSI